MPSRLLASTSGSSRTSSNLPSVRSESFDEAAGSRRRPVGVGTTSGGQRAVEMLDRHVFEARLLVVERQVAVGEGAALGVLAGEADRRPLGEKRGEGERLRVPVLDRALVEDLEPAQERLAELAMDREALGDVRGL